MLYSLLYYVKNNCTESGKDVEWSGIWENRESENVINLFCTLYEYYFYFAFFREVESVERYLKCKRFYHNMGLTIATQRN